MCLQGLTVFAISPKVYDDAGLLSAQEESAIEEKINELTESLNLDIVVVTTTDNKGKTSRAYADDFYDDNGFGFGADADGLLLLINMEDREVYISTTGIAIQYFTDQRIEAVLDVIYEDLGSANYYKAVDGFLDEIAYYVGLGIPKNQYSQDESVVPPSNSYGGNSGGYESLQEEKYVTGKRILTYLLISVGIGGLSVGVMAMNNKGVSATNENTYLRNNSFKITNSVDRHINTKVTHVTIKTQSSASSSSGRSTTHRSSSGRTHGGGGRKF